jgi:hypothetical protein
VNTTVQSIGGDVSVHGWYTVSVALVNATSVMSSVQLEFGQSGAPGTGLGGPPVMTLNPTLPFLIEDPGIAWAPVKVTEAGFCPGGLVAPAGFVQVAVGSNAVFGTL